MNVTLERDGNVALIRADNPPVNTIDVGVRTALGQALDRLALESDVSAVVLLCAGSTFFSGADIGEFSGPPQEAAYHALFARFESLGMPVVAAMHGTVMGGGLEIALACHYRIASAEARFGLPEVTLGIIPGAGGTQRLPRLIGVEKTLDLILGAKPVTAPQAKELGFIDVVTTEPLQGAAIAYARELVARGSRVRRTRELAVDAATGSPAALERLTAQARRQYRHRTAALTAIEAVTASMTEPFEAGLATETRLVNAAKITDESRGAVHAFFAERATRRIEDPAARGEARPIARAAVVGSGTMGGGIAICFANADIPVTLLDADRQALDRGLAQIDRTYESMVRRGRLPPEQKTQRLARITGTLDYATLNDADVIIEAVFENLPLKQEIFRKLDGIAMDGAILATNTSTLDIDAIAAVTRRPADVIGMHFFSPANVMPLLEVVRTADTSGSAIQSVMDLARRLRKTPVLAKVCYGFIGNRMMEGYAREAQRIVLEGATPREVDSALEDWGMAMGILAVFDMAGIDVGVNVHAANADRYPPDPTYYQADAALFAAGRLGQKNGRGYYRYEQDRSRHDDPEAIDILRKRATELGVPQTSHDPREIVERCLHALLNEGFRVLEEGVAQRASDIDVVWTAGYGFPRFRGGPMFYADTLGLPTLLAGIEKYRRIFGPMHWEPAPLLVELVQRGLGIAEWERLEKTS